MADAVLVIARFSLVEASLLEGDRRWLGSTARYYVGWLWKEVGLELQEEFMRCAVERGENERQRARESLI
jgi:hypothetical protein